MTSKRWIRRPEGSNWGDFGDDDEFGRLNLITPEKVLQGVGEVREGLSFCLSLPLHLPGGSELHPRRHAPHLCPVEGNGETFYAMPYRKIDPAWVDVVSDDRVEIYTQYSTQWDALAHIGQMFDADGDGTEEMVFYNGFRGNEHVIGPVDHTRDDAPPSDTPMGARRLGVENYATKAIQTRGVLVDLLAEFGDGKRHVSHEDLMTAMQAQSVSVEPGDILCLRTGFAEYLYAMGGTPDKARMHGNFCGLDGRDRALLDWITASGIAALCSDNFAVETVPARPGTGERYAAFPLHEHCLFKLGLPLGELWYFGELAPWLARHGRSRFLITAPALRLTGAVGSPVTPVATV